MKNISFLALLVLSPFVLSSCAAVAVTGAAATGVAAAQEGGLNRAGHDLKIQAQINDLWFRYDIEAFRKLDMTINQGRVLLTGVVQNPEHRVEAVRLAWQPKGVVQVINEIKVAESSGITGFAKDTWITARLRAGLTFDTNVQSINYSIDTVQGVVYLMGVAQNEEEINRVVERARKISGVERVVSYVKFAGEQADNYEPPAPEAVSFDEDSGTPRQAFSPSSEDTSKQDDGGAPILLTPVQREPISP